MNLYIRTAYVFVNSPNLPKLEIIFTIKDWSTSGYDGIAEQICL